MDHHRRDEGLFALICGERDFCHNVAMRAIQIYVASDGLAGLTMSDYVLSRVLGSAGYIICDGCKCNV